jgi:hypothetical protein
MGWTDGRTVNGVYMYLSAHKWLRSTFPYWDRRNGTDHIVMATHDEGSCWLPNELRNAILLTHWAPLVFPQKSRSAWPSDRYSDRCASTTVVIALLSAQSYKVTAASDVFSGAKKALALGESTTLLQ